MVQSLLVSNFFDVWLVCLMAKVAFLGNKEHGVPVRHVHVTGGECKAVTCDHRIRSLATTDTKPGFWVTCDHKVWPLAATEHHFH